MQTTNVLVLSDPPHREVKLEAAAEILGLPVDHTRLKMGFGAPEVLAASDAERATDIAQSLHAAGVSVATREGDELAGAPWPSLVSSVALADAGLRAGSGEETVEIRYDDPVFGVYCEPPADFTPPSTSVTPEDGSVLVGPAAAEALEWIPHLDLYYMRGGVPARISIAGENVAAVMNECERRFTNLVLDVRLAGVRPRRRFQAGERGFDMDMRKRYAFGTLLLRHALESISPELRDLTHYELGSRLAYVLSRGTKQ